MTYTHEDERLVYFVYFKHFKKYHIHKEDLLQSGRLFLIKNLYRYNEDKGSLITFKICLIKTGMINFLRDYLHTYRKYNDLNTPFLDYDAKVPGCEDITIKEVLADKTINFEGDLDIEYLRDACLKVLKSLKKSKLFQSVILDYLKNGENSQSAIARKYNISRQYVSSCILTFRKKLKEKLIKEKYF